jgi:hypothetical protein
LLDWKKLLNAAATDLNSTESADGCDDELSFFIVIGFRT